MKNRLLKCLCVVLTAALVFAIAPLIPIAPFNAQTAYAATLTSVTISQLDPDSAREGAFTTLSATIDDSNGTVTYKWEYSDTGAAGTWHDLNVNNATCTVPNAQVQNGMWFQCTANDSGSGGVDIPSLPIQLIAYATDLISAEDLPTRVVDTKTVDLIITTSGTGPYTYLWEKRDTPTSAWGGAPAPNSGNIYTVTGNAANIGWEYRCKVTDNSRTTPGPKVQYSSGVTLTLVDKLDITVQPTNVTAGDGDAAAFTTLTTTGGLSPVTYTWQTDEGRGVGGPWTDVSTSNVPAYTTGSVNMSMNNWLYRCEIKDALTGSQQQTITSNSVMLTVYPKPEIKTQPVDKAIKVGEFAAFTVEAQNGTSPYTFAWEVKKKGAATWTPVSPADGSAVDAAVTSTFTTVMATVGMDEDEYRCVVTDANSLSVTSSSAKLEISYDVQITATSLPDGTAEKAYSFVVQAIGKPAPTFSASNLPPGLTIDAATGEISGTPLVSGTYYDVIITAINLVGNDTKVATKKFDLVILPAPHTVYTVANPSTGGKPIADPKSALAGVKITLEANTYNGYRFDGWTFSGVSAPTTTEVVTFIMPNNNVTATARYTAIPYGSSYSGGSGGFFSPYAYYYASMFSQSYTSTSSVPVTGSTGTASSSKLSTSASALKSTKVYTTQSTKAKTLGTLKKGDRFTLLKMGDKYATVTYNGQTGYVLSENVNAGFNYTVRATATKKITIYTSMSTNKKYNYSTLSAGALINIAGRNGKWLMIIGSNGQKLYTLASGVRFN